MTTTHKIILSVTFLVLTAVFLFPARRYSDGTFNSGSGTAPRVALFSRGIFFGRFRFWCFACAHHKETLKMPNKITGAKVANACGFMQLVVSRFPSCWSG